MNSKKNSKYLYSISEIVKTINLELNNNQKITVNTIRFWEKKFSIIKSIRLNGNRRLFNKDNLEKIKFIRFLLKDRGLSIIGAQKILKEFKKLDDYNSSSVKNNIIKTNFKNKAKKILDKIQRIKRNG
ncbi:hypothetical protein JI56_02460 [SAR11 cluster bacterium PRT-SC02]|nr:hypothetical protein JI56_02460 [SAR11 cluster bacterium PRT-SC02]